MPTHATLPPTLTARIPSFIRPLLHDAAFVQRLLSEHSTGGPVHLLFPHMMKRNLQDLQRTLDAFDRLPYQIYVSHKPTPSPAFLREVIHQHVGIDVSSSAELVSALAAGASADHLSCTGVKDDRYLLLSLQHGCLHSIDSIEELQRYIALQHACGSRRKQRILLRLSHIDIPGRSFTRLPSRFGMPVKHLPEAYKILQKTANIDLAGFHLHTDEPSPDVLAENLFSLVQLMQESYSFGFRPTILDMGGGLVRPMYADPTEGSRFLHGLETALVQGTDTHTWHNATYSMSLHDKGRIGGMKPLEDRFKGTDFTETLPKILHHQNDDGDTLAHKIAESGFTLMLEPGRACLDQCGFTFMRVIDTKKSPTDDLLTLLQGHSFNLTFFPGDPGVDPLLISERPLTPEDTPCGTYLMGNLCLETDVLMHRQIAFPRMPHPHDVVVFPNTAAYVSSFWEASPHQHPQGQRVIGVKKHNAWHLCSEQTYLPHDYKDSSTC